MVINKIILSLIIIMCRVLDIAFGIAIILVALACKALETMARENDSIINNLNDKIKNANRA